MTPRKHLVSTSSPTKAAVPSETIGGSFAPELAISSSDSGLFTSIMAMPFLQMRLALESDEIAIFATKHLGRSEFSRSDEKKVHPGSCRRFVDLKDRQRRFEKSALEGPLDSELESARIDWILEPCREDEECRNRDTDGGTDVPCASAEAFWAL
jgi:hypothetical protein